MKRIGITQRVEVVPSYGERRDCLDQRWAPLLLELGLLPVPLPNLPAAGSRQLLPEFELDGVILSGGNSIDVPGYQGGDVAAERDDFERQLLTFALAQRLPVLGVCRGLQMINVHFGGTLAPTEGHVATIHDLTVPSDSIDYGFGRQVNSFHNQAIPLDGLANVLQPLALDHGANVEALKHRKAPIFGIMWHPEREDPFDPRDLSFLQQILL